MLLVSALLASGCASTAGWSLSDARTCERDAAPRVCVQAEPDYGHVLLLTEVGVEMLPGECLSAQVEGHGGGLRIATRDPRDQRHDDWVVVRRGYVTRLVIDPQGRVTTTSDRCTDQP